MMINEHIKPKISGFGRFKQRYSEQMDYKKTLSFHGTKMVAENDTFLYNF